ncbi:major facilitator superfamily domain-containing protein [Neurospora hispaniola]|uniref:Major facilitator superfamily domain-containing protein n=1 Tax=Neurospora hispaniola TaxID=588809 RepID=A0AAJ0I4Q6_9PEZI|nr:major facilitator superfamily domain-containing protein [Neurospora hispaniola]
MTDSSFPRGPPGADNKTSELTLDLEQTSPNNSKSVPITEPPSTASISRGSTTDPTPKDITSKMPETAASRKAQVVPLLDGHDDPEPSGSSSNASSSRPSAENHHHQSSSIDSLTPLTPRVIPPSHHPHEDPNFAEDDTLMTGKYALRSWLTVIGAWLAIFSSFGLLTVLSICQSYLSGENEQVASISDGTFAWVFSLYFVVSLGLGMYVGPLSDRFGARYMVLSGTVFLGVGLVVLACRSETWAILLAFGILSGLTSTFLFIPSLVTIHQFFGRSPEYYTFATSLATTAGPAAGIVFPYATRNLFHEVSWPWTIRTLGLICFFLAVIANFLIRSPPSVRSPAPSVPTSPTLSSSGKKSSPPGSADSTTSMAGGPSSSTSASATPSLMTTTKPSGTIHPSLTPFFSPSYTLLFLSLLLIHLSIYTATTYLSATSLYSQGYSFSSTFRTTTLVVNISSISGRLLAGLLSSGFPFFPSSSTTRLKSKSKSKIGRISKGLGPFNTTILFSLLATLTLLAILLPPLLHPGRTGMSPSRFTAFAVLFGLSSGAVLGVEPVLVSSSLVLVCATATTNKNENKNKNRKDGFGQFFGTLYTLISLASMAGIPIGAHLVTACQGRYWGLVVFVGVTFGVGMVGLVFVRRSVVVVETSSVKKGSEAEAAAAAAAVGEGDDGLRGFQVRKLLSVKGWWKEKKTWRELGGRVRRSWEGWGLERI